jgi:hypothetical protein
LWQLSDGTSCILLKDPNVDNWQLRVVRGPETLRSEHYGSAIVAMDEGKRWRTAFDSSIEPSAS